MTLVNGKERLTLRFDCKACEMHVMGRLKKHHPIAAT
jgi:putative protease